VCDLEEELLALDQIVGRHQDEWAVLQIAHAFEQATGFSKRRPPIATP
jgi:amidase